MAFLREFDELSLEPFVAAQIAADEFDVGVLFSKDRAQTIEGGGSFGVLFTEMPVERAVAVAGEANQAVGEFLQLIPKHSALVLGPTELGPSEHTAKVLVAAACADEQRKGAAVLQRDLAANNGANPVGLRRTLGTRGAVDAIAINDGNAVHAKFCRANNEVFGLGCATQKAEGAAGVEFGVG